MRLYRRRSLPIIALDLPIQTYLQRIPGRKVPLDAQWRSAHDRTIVINSEAGRAAIWVSVPIAVLLAGVSLGGLFLPLTYSAETPLHAAQYVGNDAGNLVLIVPVLVIVAFLALRGSDAAQLIWMGTLVYLVYDFLGYAFATHFNSMFLAYCAVLGLSFLALAASLLSLPIAEIARRCGPRTPRKIMATVLLLVGLGIIFHWTSEIIPALLAGRVPQAVLDSGLLTEPVAVLDLAFGAPVCLLVAILLLRRKPLGIVLGPVLLTFLTFSSLVLAPMGLAMARHGFESGYALCWIGVGIAVGSASLLALSVRASLSGSGDSDTS